MEETGGSSVEGRRTQEGLVWRNGEDRRDCEWLGETGGGKAGRYQVTESGITGDGGG